jgi:hypothetical protein
MQSRIGWCLIRWQPINGDGVHKPDTGLQLILHRAELELAQLREFLPRLGRYFDHGHDGSQNEMLQHCLGRLSAKNRVSWLLSRGAAGEVTHLEIMIRMINFPVRPAIFAFMPDNFAVKSSPAHE